MPPVFHHIVLLKFKDRSGADAKKVSAALLSLKGKVPTLKHIECGIDMVRGATSWDLCLVTRFEDRAGHDAYQVHPAHKSVKTLINEARESTAVVDWET